MYNLITFIEAQKKLNASDSEIVKKLRGSGWSTEQINYVIRKYVGKRTGMVEIPIKNPFDASMQKTSEEARRTPVGAPAGGKKPFDRKPRYRNKQDKK